MCYLNARQTSSSQWPDSQSLQKLAFAKRSVTYFFPKKALRICKLTLN